MINVPCPGCGKDHWLRKSEVGRGVSALQCQSCAAKSRALSYRTVGEYPYTGGKQINTRGYVSVRIFPESPCYRMATKQGRTRRVLEHRLVVANYLGRCLEVWEIVHHINGNKTDNSIENLELITVNGRATNQMYSRLACETRELRNRVTELETSNRLLLWQIKELRHGNPEPSLTNESSSSQEGVETRAEGTQPDNAHKRPVSHADKEIVQRVEEILHNVEW